MFMSSSFIGTHLYKLVQLQHLNSYQVSAASYMETEYQLALETTVSQALKEADALTMDEEEFTDALGEGSQPH